MIVTVERNTIDNYEIEGSIMEDGRISTRTPVEFIIQDMSGSNGIQIDYLEEIQTDEFEDALKDFINEGNLGVINLFEFHHGDIYENLLLTDYSTLDELINEIYSMVRAYILEEYLG